MQYKALMSDVDGTLIPYDYNAVPSKNVITAIKLAQEKLTVCLVTGRAYGFTKHILEKLDLKTGYVVLNNGAQVINLTTNKTIYDQPIAPQDIQEIVALFQKENVPFYLKQDETNLDYKEAPFMPDTKVGKGYMFFTDEIFSIERANDIFKKLSHLPNLTLHKSLHKHPDKFGINITHIKATKMHGIHVVMQELGIEKDEIIGVGDSYNDFPLLMASGLKVAMGNAIDDLKEIADYVVPSVDEDGVVELVNKFILTPTP